MSSVSGANASTALTTFTPSYPQPSSLEIEARNNALLSCTSLQAFKVVGMSKKWKELLTDIFRGMEFDAVTGRTIIPRLKLLETTFDEMGSKHFWKQNLTKQDKK